MYILHHARMAVVSRTLCNAYQRHACFLVRSTTTLLCPAWPKDSVGHFFIQHQTSFFRDDFKLFAGNSGDCRVSRRHFPPGPVPRLVEMDTLICALLPKLHYCKPASLRRQARPSTSPTQQVFCCTAKPVEHCQFWKPRQDVPLQPRPCCSHSRFLYHHRPSCGRCSSTIRVLYS